MTAYIIRRLLITVPTIVLVTVVIFAIMRSMPGGPAQAMLGDQATPEAIKAMEQRLGLDQPFHVQYLAWVGNALRGDLGRSAFGNQPVSEILLQRIPPTVELAILAMLFSVAIGITAGVTAAVYHNSRIDAAASVLAILGVSTPSFWLGIMLVLVFSIWLRWLPSMGYTNLFIAPETNVRQMILPSLTLGAVMAAVVARQTRGAMLDVLYQDYIRTARAKGLVERVVLTRHALGNALIPVVTIVGLQLGQVLSGAVVVETIFALPGNGQLLVSSIFTRDFPIVQAVVLVMALIFTAVNLAVDLLYGVLDPRVRLS
ncbi:MAG: ABC transporter permease [Dehalococcoidales bacterium]|nr:ABC transporter permease [Dehalococcoidales bacterium]